MKVIKLKDGKWIIKKNVLGFYDCEYYEHYSNSKQYRLICVDENCTKEFVEETFNANIEF